MSHPVNTVGVSYWVTPKSNVEPMQYLLIEGDEAFKKTVPLLAQAAFGGYQCVKRDDRTRYLFNLNAERWKYFIQVLDIFPETRNAVFVYEWLFYNAHEVEDMLSISYEHWTENSMEKLAALLDAMKKMRRITEYTLHPFQKCFSIKKEEANAAFWAAMSIRCYELFNEAITPGLDVRA